MSKYLLLTVLASFALFVQTSHGAFVLRARQQTPNQQQAPQAVNMVNTGKTVQSNIPLVGTRMPRLFKGNNPDDKYNSTVEGTFAVVCALFSAVAFIAFSLTSFNFFIIPALVFAVGAVIFGAIGLKRHKKGFAIAAMALGFIEIIAAFAVMAAL